MSESIEKREARKIQVVGGSTYIVSLPKKWIERNKLDRGSTVYLYETEEGLVISTGVEKPRIMISTLTVENWEIKFLERSVLSHYLAGADVIRVEGGQDMQEYRRAIRRLVRKKMIGFEVFDEDVNYIELRSFIREGDIDLEMSIKRMFRIGEINLGMIPKLLINMDRGLARSITENDDEMDRFYLYTIRLIRKAGRRDSGGLVTEAMISKTLERIMDHVSRIAYTTLAFQGGENRDILSTISETAYLVHEIYTYSGHAYTTLDHIKANETISRGKRLIRMIEEFTKTLILDDPIKTIQVNTILESLKRITEYTMDIGEMIIDLYTVRNLS